jgi:hypothetical protein
VTNAARGAIEELEQVVGWLGANLLPGTARPYSPPQMSDEKRAELNAIHIVEKRMYLTVPLGESPAPMDLDAMDLLVEILCLADELADQVSDAAEVTRLESASSAFADPTPFLRRAAAFVTSCDTRDQDRIEERCDDLIYRAMGLLGLIGDGQILQVVCPWCAGRTSKHPTGGAKTLRVRIQLPVGKRSFVKVDPKDIAWYIVCESGTCDPPSKDCGERLRGRPAWPLKTDGDFLAQRIEASIAS